MPFTVQRLFARREPTALRMVVECSANASTLREGPVLDDGSGTAWFVFLCPAHAEGLPEWLGVATHADQGSMPCGSVMDFRSADQVLQSHADLWLTSLTGVCADMKDDVLADVLTEAEQVLRLRLRLDQDAGTEDGPLRGIAMMIDLACRSAALGDLGQVAMILGYCEMVAKGLKPWHEDGSDPPEQDAAEAGCRQMLDIPPKD
ncbi:hypothetical protein [Streptomyces kaempferi]|uniref:Uncharacterized protein n=1 Tax=Streptomyces kaempferi TaxID=333725 RepID=A0ABW3XYB8_9ACTN